MRTKILLLLCYALLTASALADSNSPNEPDDKNLRTIQPHTRSAAVNAKHAQECAEMGGVDVSDDSEIKVSSDVIDSVACIIRDTEKYKEYTKRKDTLEVSNANGWGAYASVGSVSVFSGSYTISGSGGVSSGGGGDTSYSSTLYVAVPADNCRIEGGFTVNGKYGGGPFALQAACTTKSYGKQSSQAGYSVSSLRPYDGSVVHAYAVGVVNHGSSPNIADLSKNEGMPDNPPSCNMPSSFIADPINIAVGNSFQQEVDAVSNGLHPLKFIRYYNSIDGVWRHNYSANITKDKKFDALIIFKLRTSDGREVDFLESNGVFTASATELGTLKRLGTGYQYTSPFHEVSDFDESGRLIRIASNGGIITEISYYDNNKLQITDNANHVLSVIENDKHQPVQSSLAGVTSTYSYDAYGRLTRAVVGDTPTDYHYEDMRFPKALTGITNGNGVRYATWTYDDKGRADSNVLAGGKNKVSITYNSDSQTTFTNPLGRKYTYNYTVIDGLKRITSISGAASSLCPAIGSSYQYNAKGLVIAATDGRGIKTTYEYNDAGQETSRTIANGKATAVTIKTTWDDRFNLPKTETYPDKVITYSYATDGSLLEQTVKSIN
jgi:YD repeat-containing protein